MQSKGPTTSLKSKVAISSSGFSEGQKMAYLACLSIQSSNLLRIVGGIIISNQDSTGFTMWVGGVENHLLVSTTRTWRINYFPHAYSCSAVLVKSTHPVDQLYFGYYMQMKNTQYNGMPVYDQSATYMADGQCLQLNQTSMHSMFWEPGEKGGHWHIGKMWQGKVLKTFAKTSVPMVAASVVHLTGLKWLTLENEGLRFEMWSPLEINAGCISQFVSMICLT